MTMELDKNSSIAKYACDSCKISKVTCSRESPKCQRCRTKRLSCIYSRSGVIRRVRKRKHETALGPGSGSKACTRRNLIAQDSTNDDEGLQSHLNVDIEEVREQLDYPRTLGECKSLEALSSLSEACAAGRIGRGTLEDDTGDGALVPFQLHAAEWTEVFEDFLLKSRPPMSEVPKEVLGHLRAGRPDRVQEKAWLVIYHAVILDTLKSESLKKRLWGNILAVLGDVRILLEPAEINIQAMLRVLSQASQFTGPSLCWMLATNACRMLQTLGVHQRRLDSPTRKRRLAMFWHLNLLDKGLAIVFGQPPTFHKQMVKEIGLPKLEQIKAFKQHVTSDDSPGFFEVHYMHQKFLLSSLLDDIWDCLYGDARTDDRRIQKSNADLDKWYEEANRILEAAALSEKPFCDAKYANSIDVGLRTLEFHYLYLTILLTRASGHKHQQCLDASRRMLHLLQHMAPASREPYHPILWQLLCCPFTPMLILFRSILSREKGSPAGNDESLAAMEQLPPYLKDMDTRSSLASKLEGIAHTLVQHARSIMIDPLAAQPDGEAPSPEGAHDGSNVYNPHISSLGLLFGNESPTGLTTRANDDEIWDELDNELRLFTSNIDNDGLFDWINWESEIQ